MDVKNKLDRLSHICGGAEKSGGNTYSNENYRKEKTRT